MQNNKTPKGRKGSHKLIAHMKFQVSAAPDAPGIVRVETVFHNTANLLTICAEVRGVVMVGQDATGAYVPVERDAAITYRANCYKYQDYGVDLLCDEALALSLIEQCKSVELRQARMREAGQLYPMLQVRPTKKGGTTAVNPWGSKVSPKGIRAAFGRYLEKRWLDGGSFWGSPKKPQGFDVGPNAYSPDLAPLWADYIDNRDFDLNEPLTFSYWMDFLNAHKAHAKAWATIQKEHGPIEVLEAPELPIKYRYWVVFNDGTRQEITKEQDRDNLCERGVPLSVQLGRDDIKHVTQEGVYLSQMVAEVELSLFHLVGRCAVRVGA